MDKKHFGSTVKPHSNCCPYCCIHAYRQKLDFHVSFIKEFSKADKKVWSKIAAQYSVLLDAGQNN